MFIEHIDQLRCTTRHEESWLVASITQRDDRFVITGTLGCHICRRQYPIIDGVAYFGTTPADRRQFPIQSTHDNADTDTVIRIAALLNATERSTLVLCGVWGDQARALAEMIPLTVFVMTPGVPVGESPSVSHVESAEGIPLAHASVNGVALDEATATPRNVASALHVLRPGARLVAPTSVALPEGVVELARDDSFWVAETVSNMIPLRRA